MVKKGKTVAHPERDPPPDWQLAPATYLAGRAYVDAADALAIEMERKWGVGRLRLLVAPDLRERFDRQRLKFNTALNGGKLDEVERESKRMCAAWAALDAAAVAAGATVLAPVVWEVGLEDGSVAALVRDNVDAHAVVAEGRKVQVWTLEEVARIIHAFPAIAKAKSLWPGAEVISAKRGISDPLDGMDDAIPF